MTVADFSNRPKPPTAAALRESCDRAIADLDRLMALPPGHPETLRKFLAGRERLIVPPGMTQAQVTELERLAYGDGSLQAAGEAAHLWHRCYACGHRLAYPATSCAQCDVMFDDRAQPVSWPDDCTCRLCRQARGEEQS